MDITHLTARLAERIDPMTDRPFGASVRGLTPVGSTLTVHLQLPYPVGGYDTELRAAMQPALVGSSFEHLNFELLADIGVSKATEATQTIAGIKNIIAVSSGKGGVGKSTTAANLAVALAAQGAKVGLLDADVYGPSQPLMMGLSDERPTSADGKKIIPLKRHGVVVMSIGFLVPKDQPMVWRGPMVTQALTQLLHDTVWGELDYLIVDMPPGTGDTQLTMAQRVPVSGVVIVTTPQEVAVADAIKGLLMWQKVSIPVLGVVENMSAYHCPECGHEAALFGQGGGRLLAEAFGLNLLAELPLMGAIGQETDRGAPIALQAQTPQGMAFMRLARKTAAALTTLTQQAFPKIHIENA
jgi:ATP-binding protein involved in chromosome partitioning